MKKQYYKFSNGMDFDGVIMSLEDIAETIKYDSESFHEGNYEEYQAIIELIYLTDEEFENLPEASI